MSEKFYHSAGDDYLSDINVTPFVDVLLVLLVIFLVTLPLVIQTIPVGLPEATLNQKLSNQDPVYVGLDNSGQYFINGRAESLDKIIEELLSLKTAGKLGILLIEADKDNSYGNVVELIGELQLKGFEKVGISVINKK